MDAAATSIWQALSDPWSEAILRRALLEVALLGIAGGAIGCWVVLYGLSYSAESLAHALFPGLVAAALLGAPLLAGAAVGVLVAAGAINLAGRVQGLEQDTAVGVAVTSLFGLGALLALAPASPPGAQSLLFGDILGVSNTDLLLAAGLVLAMVPTLALMHGRLLAAGFDRSSAQALGISAARVELVLLLLVALAVVISVQGLGNLLVVAVVVGPAATARMLARRMTPMVAIACFVAIVCGVGGIYLSYYARTAAGASIAALIVAAFVLTTTATRVARR
jgi:ABC-type Mn2+/Zn2+ transport system permease subunit